MTAILSLSLYVLLTVLCQTDSLPACRLAAHCRLTEDNSCHRLSISIWNDDPMAESEPQAQVPPRSLDILG